MIVEGKRVHHRRDPLEAAPASRALGRIVGRGRSGRIHEEPSTVDPRTDTYLAAVAEHVATTRGLRVPPWTRHVTRFLDHFWWPSAILALHARAVVESPAAFGRRGIFIGRTTLQRV